MTQAQKAKGGYRLKRALDLGIALPSLAVFGPGMLVTAALIRAHDRGKAIFTQERVGQDDSRFVIQKFRSMPMNTGNVQSREAGALKVTPIGKIIRRTSIDELPQLLNVVRGDMSIVGPRPALPSQEGLVAMRRDNGAIRCKPGLTGLAQVHGYDGMPDEEKAGYDGEYARTESLMTDLRIILRTFIYLTKPPPRY